MLPDTFSLQSSEGIVTELRGCFLPRWGDPGANPHAV